MLKYWHCDAAITHIISRTLWLTYCCWLLLAAAAAGQGGDQRCRRR
jgi:hypothetical protein